MTNEEIIKKAIGIKNTHNFTGQYICIIDFSRTADKHRLFIVNVQSETIKYSFYTTHGSNSGPLSKAKEFSNVPNSRKSSIGLMKTAEIYNGKYGKSLKLDGLEPGNNQVRNRAIVIHPSNYVTKEYIEKNTYPGRSWGCFCLTPKDSNEVIDMIANGSYVGVYA